MEKIVNLGGPCRKQPWRCDEEKPKGVKSEQKKFQEEW